MNVRTLPMVLMLAAGLALAAACGDTPASLSTLADGDTTEPPKITVPDEVALTLPAEIEAGQPVTITVVATTRAAGFDRGELEVVASGVADMAPIRRGVEPSAEPLDVTGEVLVEGVGQGEIVATLRVFDADGAELWAVADHVQLVATDSGVVYGRSGFLRLEEQALKADLAAGLIDPAEYEERLEAVRAGGAAEDIVVEP